MRPPILLDTTLRDGEQSPGIYFTHSEKIEIAGKLDLLGVNIIEAGIPAMGKSEQQSLYAISQLGLKAEIISWNRLLKNDVIKSLDVGIASMHLSIPSSDIMIKSKLNKDYSWVLEQIFSVVTFAKEQGAIVSIGAEDGSRADLNFLKQMVQTAYEAGAFRFRFADTLGIMTPSQVINVIGTLSKCADIEIDFHGHNDFGMATANALSAWESGASVISCSLLGLGERAGNTSLEEFMAVLSYLKDIKTSYNFVLVKDICQRLAAITEIPLSQKKPVFGNDMYMHESGIHVDGILKDPKIYEYFSPKDFGASRCIVAGKHSGKKAIRYLAKQEGVQLDDKEISLFLDTMRLAMASQKGVKADQFLKKYLKIFQESHVNA